MNREILERFLEGEHEDFSRNSEDSVKSCTIVRLSRAAVDQRCRGEEFSESLTLEVALHQRREERRDTVSDAESEEERRGFQRQKAAAKGRKANEENKGRLGNYGKTISPRQKVVYMPPQNKDFEGHSATGKWPVY